MSDYLKAMVGGHVFEVRLLKCSQPRSSYEFTASGYFDDVEKAMDAIQQAELEWQPKGSYITLNSVDSTLHARCADEIKQAGKDGSTTGDGDVIKRRRLLIDCDPKRKSNISASDAELNAAIETGQRIKRWLRKRFRWPEPVVTMISGNGFHLDFAINLPNDNAATALVGRVLATLAAKFDDDKVAVDTCVGNAARITKIVGTWTRKGSNTDDRPWRKAALLTRAKKRVCVSKLKLEKVAAVAPAPQCDSASSSASHTVPSGTSRLDVPRWLTAKGIKFRAKATKPGENAVFILDQCPFNADHDRGEAAITQSQQGQLRASCKHSSCSKYRWSDFRDKIGKPDDDHYDPPRQRRQHNGRGDVEAGFLNAEPFDMIQDEPTEWLWSQYIPRGAISLVDADPESGKSHTLLDLVARVTRGDSMPLEESRDDESEPRTVILLSAEDDPSRTVGPRLEAAGADKRKVINCASITTISGEERGIVLPQDIPQLEELVVKHNAAVVGVDPISAFLSADINAHVDADVRRALAPLARMAQRTNAAVIIVRHLNKKSGGSPMYRGGGSVAFIAQARAAILLGKDPKAPELRVLASYKNNLAKKQPSLTYRIESAANGSSRIVWVGKSQLTAHDIIDHDQHRASKSTACERAIFDMLINGPMKSNALKSQVLALTQVSERTYDSARTHCKVLSRPNPRSPARERWTKLPGQEFPWEVEQKGKRK